MSITAAQLNVKISTEGADRAKRDLADIGGAVDKSNTNSRMLGAGLLGIGGAIAGVFGYGAQQAIGFGEAMANVNSIAQLSSAELDTLSGQVLDLASATGQGPETLAAGLYDIASSGFKGAEGMTVLAAAANAANAGLTTTEVSAKGITAVLNAYHLSASDAAHVSDVLFQTVNDGVITFEQLSANMGNTLPLANSLGISVEELGAGYAQMTLSGVGASQAETQLASLMRSAINPTDALTAAVQQHGYASVESLIATEGMSGYLDLLTEASGGSKTALFDLLGTQEAMNAALLLGGDNTQAYRDEVEKMQKSSEGLGATQTALSKQMESTAFSIRLLKTNIQAAAIAIGVQLEPGIRFVAKGLTTLIKGFLNLSKPVQQIIGVVLGLTGVIAGIAGAWILFGTQISAAAGLFLSLLGPIALVVAAVVGLYAAWQANLFGIRDIASNVFGGIMDFVSPVTDFLGRFMDAWNGPSEVMDQINAWGGLNADGTTKSVMDQINAWGGLTDEMTLAQKAMAAFDVATGGALTRLREMSALDIVVAVGNWIIDGLAGMWDEIARKITGTPQGEPVSLADVVVSILSWAKGEIVDLWSKIKEWAGIAGGGIKDAMVSVGSILVNIGDWAKGVIPSLWDKITEWAGIAGMAIKGAAISLGGVLVNIGEWAKGIIPPLWDKIKEWSGMAGRAIKGAAVSIGSVLVNIGDWLQGEIPDLWSKIKGWAALAGGALKGAAVSIGNVLVDIASWAKGVIPGGLWGKVKNWVGEAWGAVRTAGIAVYGVTVDIASWTEGKILAPIGGSIDSAVQKAYADYVAAGVAPKLDSVPVDISGYKITAPVDGFSGDMPDPNDDPTWYDKGFQYGFVAGQKIVDGINSGIELTASFFGAGSGGGEGGNTTFAGLADAVIGGFNGFMTTMSNGMRSIPTTFYNEVMAPALTNMFGPDSPLAHGIQAAGDQIKSLFSTIFSGSNGLADMGNGEGVATSMGGSEGLASEILAVFTGAFDIVGSSVGGLIESAFGDLKGTVQGIFQDIWSVIGDTLEAAMLPVINRVIGWINKLIDAFNSIPGSDISHIPEILSDAQAMQAKIVSGAQQARAAFAAQAAEAKNVLLVMQGQGPLQRALNDELAITVDEFKRQIEALRTTQPDQPFLPPQMDPKGVPTAFIIPAPDTSAFDAGMAAAKATLDSFKASLLGGDDGRGAAGTGGFVIPAVDTSAFTTSLDSATASATGFQTSLGGIFGGGGDGGRGAAGGAAGPSSMALPAVETSAFTGSLNTATATAANAMASIRTVIASGLSSIVGAAVSMMAGFAGAVRSGMATALSAVQSGVSSMVMAAKFGAVSMSSAGSSMGHALGNGVAAGISASTGSAVAAAYSLVSQVNAAMKIAAIAKSPSRLTRDEVGMMLGLGVAVGIADSVPAVVRESSALIQSAVSSMAAPRSGFTGGGALAYAGSASSGGSPTYNVYVTVQGNVTTERELTGNIAREVGTAMRDDFIRHTTAAGVAQ